MAIYLQIYTCSILSLDRFDSFLAEIDHLFLQGYFLIDRWNTLLFLHLTQNKGDSMQKIVLAGFLALLLVVFNSSAESKEESAGHGASSGGHGSGAAVHWGYDGSDGPQNWGNLSEAYALCGKGKNQSPINITWSADVDLDNIEFFYQNSPLSIVNNGHTIQVNYRPGSYIKIAGQTYELLQFHFHSQSEHLVNGKHSELEMHLVHKSDEGTLAVVGVFIQAGKDNSALQKIWDYLPRETSQEVAAETEINAAALLPQKTDYYHYAGSLTTPPCSEGVRWFVMTSPIEVSEQQIADFTAIFAGNFRPVQALNRRNVFLK